MIIALTGPSLASLKQAIGTKRTVQFGSITMTVESLCAAGSEDSPIALPGHVPSEPASAWYTTGDCEDEVDDGRTVVVFATYAENGRMRCAAVLKTHDEGESARASVAPWSRGTFEGLVRAIYAEQPEHE